MGSGSLAAMAVFEAGFKEDLSRDDAIALVARAIRSGLHCALLVIVFNVKSSASLPIHNLPFGRDIMRYGEY